jgi:uncharacterized protein (TIGR03083 family)
MDVADHLDHLAGDGLLLTDAAARAGLDAQVAACRWDVRSLVTHIGGVHRWAADIVHTAAPSGDTAAGRAVGQGPGDAALLEWFRDGHAALMSALRAAPADLACFAFLPAPSPLAFWARRQAHETGIHRADAESASGAITPFAPSFAQDGIAEMLHGFAARRSNAVSTPGTIALRPTDGGVAWLVTLGGDRIAAEPSDADADAVVGGSSSDLYLWLWNRPAEVTVTGDAALAELWRTVRVRWA